MKESLVAGARSSSVTSGNGLQVITSVPEVKKAPKDDSKRHTMLGELQKTIAKRSISQGNDDTFKHAHARFKQVIAEVEEMLASLLTGPVEKPEAVSDNNTHKTIRDASVTPKAPAMPMKTVKQMKKAARVNKSRLCQTKKKP
eukprot:scaffold21335_cov88-Cyclotella_meneghiniana.AAC.1